MRNKLRFLVKNRQNFIALFVLLVMVFNACKNPVSPPAKNPEGGDTDDFTPVGFYVDSEGNFTEKDSGRTVLVTDDKAEVVFYSDNIESDDDDRVGITFEDKTIIFLFEKDKNFPSSIVLSSPEGSYYGIFTSYDPETQTYGLTIEQGDEMETLSNVFLSNDIFTQYEYDEELTPSQNQRMHNLHIAMCIYTSLDEFFKSDDTLLSNRGLFGFIFKKVAQIFFPPPVASIVAGIAVTTLGAAKLMSSNPISMVTGLSSLNEGTKLIADGINALTSVAVTGVSLNKTVISLAVGASETLSSAIKPSNASNKSVSWSSSNTAVATVSSNGTVTAVARGSATITVTTANGGKKAACTVSVTNANVTFSSVTANGSISQTSNQLTLIFSQAIIGLSASDITLSGVSGVIKGTLSGSGPSYTLPISGFTVGGTLSVAVTSPSGYNVSGSPKTVTIYQYTPPCTITFDSNGGTSVTTQTVTPGGTATRPTNPTRSGYTFDNWYSDSDMTTVYNFSAAVTTNITLYAKWNPVTTAVDIVAIQGVTVPATGGIPVTAITENAQYSGTVSWSPAVATGTAKTVKIDMYDSSGDGWDNGGALRININGADIANNVRVQSGYTNTYIFNVVAGDVVQLYWVAGTYQEENSFIVYYADTPPSPVFTTSDQGPTNWSGSNALVYRLRNTMDGISGGTLLGSFTNSGTFAVATQYTATITLAVKSGYTLQGVAANFFKVAGATTVSNSANSGVVTAKFPATNSSYTVTFESNGGSSVSSQTVNSGGTTTRPTNPTRSGYIFDNWYSNSELTTVYDFSTVVTKNITLYAKWNSVTYTVTFVSNGGSSVTTQTVNSGSTATRPTNPTRSGYTFDNWYSNSGLTTVYNFSTPINGNITLYAKWNSISSTTFIEMVQIPAGTFTMGSPSTEAGRWDDEGPQHSVTLSGFYMGKYQVTQEQYQKVMGTNPSYYSSNPASGEVQGKRPVECVSWYDAIVFCNKLSIAEGLSPAYRISGSTNPADWGSVPTSNNNIWDSVAIVASSNGYRLPTEAQWEYACCAGTTTAYNTGNNISDNTGWYTGNSGDKTHQVGLKPANAWGLYDMHGNVWEWCWDWYGNYSSGNQTDPVGAAASGCRVPRGGSWGGNASSTRSASRGSSFPYIRYYSIGFRLVRP